ncbi:uncharacterized protein LOC110847144 [Folsomia candida]|uniref:Chitin-binding type-4 domain-containing protein n=1 Tax=Folsomia candida TaxID=158441 RepID=A0A226EG93_FOLCA|nr:uncharacterized protein LOC110847144 [Folsomia candida]OXA56683.1 hypothetical protein Fcan01_06538 [Folsomia candida]
MFKSLLLSLLLVSVWVGEFDHVDAHGKMMKPPNRSSIWRVPEFSNQNPPANYNDNELYCGAIHQVDDPGSNCGVCGDPQAQSTPRDNEVNGRWYRGIIVGDYTRGQNIDIEIDLNAAHLGAMEWRLCTNPATENQACFNNHLLQLTSGGTKLYVTQGPGFYRTQATLPSGVTCEHCILQWNYRGGNQYGDCGNGTSGLGCGPQETFRGCADVRIR